MATEKSKWAASDTDRPLLPRQSSPLDLNCGLGACQMIMKGILDKLMLHSPPKSYCRMLLLCSNCYVCRSRWEGHAISHRRG